MRSLLSGTGGREESAVVSKCYSYIRFSTPEQLKGDSLRRQLETTRAYANEKGLELDEELTLKDLGLSAYKGHHRTKGALGKFFELIKADKIPKGSTLIVESLDRLSREQVSDAYDQFRDIIKAGVRIVTLDDRMEYTRESINANFSQLIISLTIMSRAHEESQKKSMRVSAARDAARKKAAKGEGKLTARCVAWLELVSDNDFEIKEDRAAIVRSIYEMKLAGVGPASIAKYLNEKGKSDPNFWMPDGNKRLEDKKPGWRKSYVQKILRNPAVIGEYQPHSYVRDPEDENYGKR